MSKKRSRILCMARKLFRARPVIAWSVTSFILVLFSGIYDGLSPDITLAVLSLLVVVIMQGISSHALNDIADEEVDKRTDIGKTGRYKLLASNKATRSELWLMFIGSILISMGAGIYIYTIRGTIILILLMIGVFLIYMYNFNPFKLNYRPFAEYTTVFPTIIFISLGISYSVFGCVTTTILLSAIANAFMNISWYLFSRLQDIKPDMISGKKTSFVWVYKNFNRSTESLFAYAHSSLIIYALLVYRIENFITAGMIVVYLAYILFNEYTPKYYDKLRDHDVLSVFSANMRRAGIYITYVNCILLSLTLFLYK